MNLFLTRLRLAAIVLAALAAFWAGGVARWRLVEKYGVRDKMALGTDGWLHYVSCAEHLVLGEGFTSAYNLDPHRQFTITPPLQPLFIAAVYKTAGNQNLINVYRVQLVINLLAGLIVFWILYRWAGALAALAGLWIWMLYPEFSYWTRLPMTESNYYFLMLAMLWGIAWWWRKPSIGRAALAAGLIGLANLQRAVAIDLGLALGPVAWLLVKDRRQRWGQIAILALLPFAVLLPWMLYNLHRCGDAVWSGSNGGYLCYAANRPGFDPIKYPEYMKGLKYPENNWKVQAVEDLYRAKTASGYRSNYLYSKLYMNEFYKYVAQHPVHFTKNMGIKFVQRFVLLPDVPNTVGMVYRWMKTAGFAVMFYSLLFFGVLGIFARRAGWRDPSRQALVYCFAYYAALTALFPWDDDGRYTLDLQVFLMFFAAVALARFVRGNLWFFGQLLPQKAEKTEKT